MGSAQGTRFVIARPQRGRGALSAKREEVPLGCNLGEAPPTPYRPPLKRYRPM